MIIKIQKDDRLSIESELYNAGTTEDGTPYEAEAFSIQLQSSDGRRLAHTHMWFTAERSKSPDGFSYFSDKRVAMKQQAERLLTQIRKKGELNDQYWVAVEPSYGSEAYCQKHGF